MNLEKKKNEENKSQCLWNCVSLLYGGSFSKTNALGKEVKQVHGLSSTCSYTGDTEEL